jgi:hypothetical protein
LSNAAILEMPNTETKSEKKKKRRAHGSGRVWERGKGNWWIQNEKRVLQTFENKRV